MNFGRGKKGLCLALICTVCVVAGAGGAAARSRTFTTRPDYSIPSYRVYLSPSCQTWNPYCDGSGSEEYHMRQVAEAMGPYLKQDGIQYVLAAAQTGSRANQRNTIVNRAKQASNDHCDLYLAIHSNARDNSPKKNGTTIFYPTGPYLYK